jgi:transposase
VLDRHDLTDVEWALLERLLPDRTPRRGGRWMDHRQVVDAVLWRTRAGTPWRDLPECYGNWKTVYNRHRRWAIDGVGATILDELRRGCDQTEARTGRWPWTAPWSGHTSTPPAPATSRPPSYRRPRRTPRSPTQGDRSNDKNSRQCRESLGRSCGGLTTKIVLAADLRARPLSRVVIAGHRHDSICFQRVMSGIRILRHGRGRPRTTPRYVLGDKAFSNRAIRAHLRRRGIAAVIPEPADQIKHRRERGSQGGRPPAFDVERYKQRNVVERCNNKLKGFRAVATRYDKRDYMYQATVDVASIRIWLKDPVP